VESAVQAAWLVENGCRYATGYFYARPMPVREFEEWLSRSPDARIGLGPLLGSTL